MLFSKEALKICTSFENVFNVSPPDVLSALHIYTDFDKGEWNLRKTATFNFFMHAKPWISSQGIFAAGCPCDLCFSHL